MSKNRETLNLYKGRRVFITGHTGFKGSWLTAWLERLGAEVTGFSHVAPTQPAHFTVLHDSKRLKVKSIVGDIRDSAAIERAMGDARPEIVFHLAAQPIVRRSYRDPVETFETNVMGTLKVLEACRKTSGLKAVINVTSDKCYENREWAYGYRENDPMGGYDPYSASKGCAELVASSFQRSYFPVAQFGDTHGTLLASVRAGNVIGGGDWAEDRLIPDLIRTVSTRSVTEIRNPSAIRPWQHVLEPLAGYMLLGSHLLQGDKALAEPFNFGPDPEGCVPVGELLTELQSQWRDIKFEFGKVPPKLHEAHFLKLDSGKARSLLGWKPRLDFKETVQWTAEWYREFHTNQKVLTFDHIDRYTERL